jgi:hypothetical protein
MVRCWITISINTAHQIGFLGMNLERGPVNSFEECLAVVTEDFNKQMRETFRVEFESASRPPCGFWRIDDQ